MKLLKNLNILILLMLPFLAEAQDVTGNVLNSGGASVKIGDITMDWAIGGILDNTFNISSAYVTTQGFLQPETEILEVTLTFNEITDKTYGDISFPLNATASNGGKVAYSIADESVAKLVDGNIIQIAGAGSTEVIAMIEGTDIAETRTLVVHKAGQTITIELIPTLIRGGAPYSVIAKATSGLPVSIATNNGFSVKVQGQTITPIGLGTSFLLASQAGDKNYLAAETVSTPVTVVDANGATVYVPKALSPNGDGVNDLFVIEGIEKYPKNELIIVNRNGTKIFYAKNYDNSMVIFSGKANPDNVFDGKSQRSVDNVPAGTYFYNLRYTDENNKEQQKTGYFVVLY